MALSNDNVSMALYCDFENVALGVRDAKYNKFDIKPVLERLLLKGSIVVKKAYCDWDRYKEFKAQMHEASFELIEIPHVRQSGKNSADIRLVVDALDLCYTKAHVNAFVIISGDSDFSPLVSKLRENAKYVIGVGVKDSTSDLLIANCDEFIFIDDLMRENRRTIAKRAVKQAPQTARASVGEELPRKEEAESRKGTAIDIALETFEALLVERGDTGKIWASTLKQAIKRRKPDFNENYFGFKTFGNLLEEAQARGLLEIGRDERSGAYVSRSGTARQEAGSAMAGSAKEGNAQHALREMAADTPDPTSGGTQFPHEASEPLPNSFSAEAGSVAAKEPARQSRTASRKGVAKKRAVKSAQSENESAASHAQETAPAQATPEENPAKRKGTPRTGRRKSAKEPAADQAVTPAENTEQ